MWFEPLPSYPHVATMNLDESSLADSLTHVLGPLETPVHCLVPAFKTKLIFQHIREKQQSLGLSNLPQCGCRQHLRSREGYVEWY